MGQYNLNIDHNLLYDQKLFITRILLDLRVGKPVTLTEGCADFLEGVLNLLDGISDQAEYPGESSCWPNPR